MRDRLFVAYQRRRHQSARLRKVVDLLPGARRVHRILYRSIRPEEIAVGSNGFSVLVDPRDEVIGATLICGGQWEPFEVGVFQGLIGPGSIVADVGANIGLYTLTAARAAGTTGQVVAFEPDPQTAELLRRNVERNGCADRVTVLQEALGDAAGTVRLYRDRSNRGNYSLAATNVSLAGWTDVRCSTLDAALQERGVTKLDVLKLDVQGAESKVIAGARAILPHTSNVFMEFWPRGLSNLDADPLTLLRTMSEEFGFRYSWIDAEGRALVDMPTDADTVAKAEQLEQIDLLFTRA